MEQKDAFAYVTILDRDVALNKPTDGQIAQITRAVSAIQRSGAQGGAASVAMARAMDVLLALIVTADDLYFVDEGLTDGSINLEPEMTGIMSAVASAFGDEDEAPAPKTGPVKKARAQRGSR